MGYALGKHSRKELEQVEPILVQIVEMAIATSPVDFQVHDGIRNLADQRALVDAGASFTMRSLHLPGEMGMGRAVDLVPWIAGKLRWDWEPIFPIAVAMRDAAITLGVGIRWGGAWDMLLTDPVVAAPQQLMNMYAARRHAAQKRVYLDGPHYELLRSEYPDAVDS